MEQTSVTKQQPQLRVRIAHTHTLKEGWRCSETTIEFSGAENPDWFLIDAMLQGSFDRGRDEADRRNHPDDDEESI